MTHLLIVEATVLMESPSNCGNNKETKVSAEIIGNYRVVIFLGR
jgi:hypothetical protein